MNTGQVVSEDAVRFMRLLDMVQELSAGHTTEQIVAVVCRTARELTDAQGATLVLREADACYYADEDAISPLWKGRRLPLDACMGGWAIEHREAAAVEDIDADPRVPQGIYQGSFVKSLLVVPIRPSDPIGAVAVYWDRRHRADAQEQALLQAIANAARDGLETVQCQAERERRLTALETEVEERRQAQTALADSHARLANLIGLTMDAILGMDADQRIVLFNEAASRMFGCAVAEAIGLPFEHFVPERLRDICRERIRQFVAGGMAAPRMLQLGTLSARHASGEEFPIEATLSRAEVGGQLMLNMIIRDLSERQRIEDNLRQSEARLQLALETAQLGILDIDLQSSRVRSNARLLGMLDYQPGEIPMTRDGWIALVHPDNRDAIQQAFDDLFSGRILQYQTELSMLTRSGDWRWILLHAQAVGVDQAGKPHHVTSIHLDVSERRLAEERVQRVAQHDELTGLPNRALAYEFSEQVLAACRRGQVRGAVLLINLDNFKPLNETYGQTVGDAALKELATRIKSGVRREDVVGRLGEDEFLAVLSHINNPEHAAQAAAHLLLSVSQPYQIERADDVQRLELQASCSIGISIFPDHGKDLETLVKHADSAMYRAKAEGRDTFCFYSTPN